ncbi:hypothetical protein N0V90_008052 [Kalmusia sp. IMI 367209]|nr:hypothetical protein N0V90_008052 [Kalmusia sp. IMI 367209]
MASRARNPHAASEDATDDVFISYLRSREHHCAQTFLNPDNSMDDAALVQIFQWRTAALSHAAYTARVTQKKAWTPMMIQLHSLSRAFSESILVSTFFDALSSPAVTALSPPAPSVLRTCFRLFTLHTLSQSSTSFLLAGSIPQSALEALDEKMLELMGELRPHAVKLVDAWAVPDWLLDSALGRYDGRVYEELFERAHRRNPLNGETFNVDWRSEEIVLGSGDGGGKMCLPNCTHEAHARLWQTFTNHHIDLSNLLPQHLCRAACVPQPLHVLLPLLADLLQHREHGISQQIATAQLIGPHPHSPADAFPVGTCGLVGIAPHYVHAYTALRVYADET